MGTMENGCRIVKGHIFFFFQKVVFQVYVSTDTLPKTNIAPTNGWLEYYFPIGEAYFQGLR